MESAWKYFVGDPLPFDYDSTIKVHNTHQGLAIEFLGVWDTVYGFNTANALRQNPFMRLRFRNFLVDRSVKHVVHILSIDDNRRYFAPMLFEGSRPDQTLEQIWMPGVHSDIGGGYSKSFLANVSLLTMIDKLRQYCPKIEYDRPYFDKQLLRILREQDPVINNERQKYFFFGNFRPIHRHVDGTIAERKQSIHPLTAVMLQRPIFIRTKKTLYKPGYKMGNIVSQLGETIFHPTSHHNVALKGLLQHKFQ